MASPIITGRRMSSQQQHDDIGHEETLSLARTLSQEPAIAESIAISVPEDFKKIVNDESNATQRWPHSTRYLVLLCAFLTSLSFGVTQVPMLYVFRLMTCDGYYEDHPSKVPMAQIHTSARGMFLTAFPSIRDFSGMQLAADDRCSIRPIESSTALSISLLGASTTVFGLLNLFLTSSLIKSIGVKSTLTIQTFFPALRLLVQNIGVEVWGYTGIVIIQCSQIVSIIGGPSGYLLVLNTFMTEVVEYEGRTAALGRLTGSMMSGSALGFLLGGVIAESFGIKAPFRLTLMLFLISCAYGAIFLPYIQPANGKDSSPKTSNKRWGYLGKFFGPLAVFAPKKYIGRDEVVRTEYGSFLLAWGVFLGILATGYLPTLLQLYSTDVFGFGTKQNGWLIFMYSMLRGVFLTFAFPKLISIGRKWTVRNEEARNAEGRSVTEDERAPLLAPQQNINGATDIGPKKAPTFTFDLTYTRFSLIADGLLTLLCSFVREGWQMYLVAAVLPFAAGTGAASKGTILQMVGSSASSSERTDALAGISLVENMARLSTTFVFGVIFAAFASIGRTELVFICNAAFAMVGFGVMLFARFPPEDSRPLTKEEPPKPTQT